MNKISRKGFLKIAAAAAMSGVTAGALAACNAASGSTSTAASGSAAASGATGTYIPGTYEGTAEGYNGTMTVYVGIDSTGTITSVRVGSSDDDFVSKVSDEAFTAQFVGKTSTDGIETISGATVSSSAFIKAVEAALAAQKGA